MTEKHLAATLLFLIGFIAVSSPLHAGATRSLYGEANQAFWDEEYDTAVAKFRRFLEENPNHSLRWDAHFGLARALNKLNRLKRSLRHYRLVQQNHPNRALRGDALFSEFEIAVARNHPRRARERLETFLNTYPEHALAPIARKQLRLLRPPDSKAPSRREGEPTTTVDPDTATDRGETADPAVRPDTSPRSPDSSGVSPSPSNTPATDSGSDTPTRSDSRRGGRTAADRVFPDEPESPPTGVRGEPGESPGKKRSEQGATPDELSELRQRLSRLQNRVRSQRETLEDLRSTVRRFRTRNELLKKERDRLRRQRDRLRQRVARLERSAGESSSGPQHTKRADLDPPGSNDEPPGDSRREQEVSSRDFTGAGEPDTPSVDPDPLTDQQLRRRVEQHRRRKNYARAIRLQKRLLERSPTGENYYRAARLHRLAGQPPQPVLRNLDAAIQASDTVPVKYLLLKAQVHLETGRIDAFDRLVEDHGERIVDVGGDDQESRYYYLLGRRSLRVGEKDAGFFEFMESIRAAPESRWARMSRRVVKSEL